MVAHGPLELQKVGADAIERGQPGGSLHAHVCTEPGCRKRQQRAPEPPGVAHHFRAPARDLWDPHVPAQEGASHVGQRQRAAARADEACGHHMHCLMRHCDRVVGREEHEHIARKGAQIGVSCHDHLSLARPGLVPRSTTRLAERLQKGGQDESCLRYVC